MTSVLQRQLVEGGPPGRTTALDAFRLARRHFLEGRRIDMSALAAELGVNRVTLYRWIGSRDKLLVEIIWSLGSRTLENEARRTRKTGGERVAVVLERFVEAVLSNPGFSQFLKDEGELAMRLLTRRDMDFQPRLIDAIERLLRREVDAGRLDLRADVHDVAYTAVRVIESYIYLDLITGETPDSARAGSILTLLLR